MFLFCLLGTRENKAKTESGESLQNIICDKLLWLCRGCKDSETTREPAVQPINSEERPILSETSSASDVNQFGVLDLGGGGGGGGGWGGLATSEGARVNLTKRWPLQTIYS